MTEAVRCLSRSSSRGSSSRTGPAAVPLLPRKGTSHNLLEYLNLADCACTSSDKPSRQAVSRDSPPISGFLPRRPGLYARTVAMAGFDFSNYNRNAALHARGVPLPKATSTGTTIVGCIFDNGVVVSSSNQWSEQYNC